MVTVYPVVASGKVARELGKPQHRFEQIVDTRQHIRPLRRVGIVRAHVLERSDLVQAPLEAIDRHRGKVPKVRHCGRTGCLTRNRDRLQGETHAN